MESGLVIVFGGFFRKFEKNIKIRIFVYFAFTVPHAFVHVSVNILTVMGIILIVIKICNNIPIILEIEKPDIWFVQKGAVHLIHGTNLCGKSSATNAVIPI